ncbi:MAG: hypothetical protein ABI650_07680 [Dokdonella sp.]
MARCPSCGHGLSPRRENLGDWRYREHGSGIDEAGRSAIAILDWRF